LEFSIPSHLDALLNLPPALSGLVHIPDSVEILHFATSPEDNGNYELCFGRESKLELIKTTANRSFLRFSSETLKLFRSKAEFGRDECRPGRKGRRAEDD
jgi:hypothetical protein